MKRCIVAICAACLAAAAAFGGVAAARPAHHAKKHCVRRHHKRRCTKRRSRHRQAHPPTITHPATEPTPTPSTPGGTTTPPPQQIAHLQVTEREFSIIPSRTTVAGGAVAVELDNRGEDPHNLRVERTDGRATAFDFDLARPGSVTTKTLDLGAGTWKLYCTLPGHDAMGMHAQITVTG